MTPEPPEPPNPFRDWLPMYGRDLATNRPWWKLGAFEHPGGTDPAWVRCDGEVIVYGDGARWGDFRALEEYDTKHPLPVPPPMVGQVWRCVDTDAEHAVRSIVAGVVKWGETGEHPVAKWPPSWMPLLVAGPTPWGRDCPWAPAGWKP